MGFFDRLTGRQEPAVGLPGCGPDEVVGALVGLNGSDVPYAVRDGAADGVTLVAEWRMTEPAWFDVFERSQVDRTFRVLLRLDERRREVRTRDEQWEVTWTEGVPTLTVAVEHRRGIVLQSSGRTSIGPGSAGDHVPEEVFRFSSEDLKRPLRAVVLRCGWTWRPVAFGRL